MNTELQAAAWSGADTIPSYPGAVTNEQRADLAYRTLLYFAQLEGLNSSDIYDAAITDLLADLMHLCRQSGPDFNEHLRVATDHHNAEVCESRMEAAQ